MSEIHAHEIVVEEVLCGPFQLEIQSVGEVRGAGGWRLSRVNCRVLSSSR